MKGRQGIKKEEEKIKKMTVMTVIIILLTVSLFAGCGKNPQAEQPATAATTAEDSLSGDPAKVSTYADDVVKAVAACIPCSEQDAEKILAEIEEISNSKITAVEVYSIAELPDNIMRILQCEAKNEETYIVSISEDNTIMKVVHMQGNVVFYDYDDKYDAD